MTDAITSAAFRVAHLARSAVAQWTPGYPPPEKAMGDLSQAVAAWMREEEAYWAARRAADPTPPPLPPSQ